MSIGLFTFIESPFPTRVAYEAYATLTSATERAVALGPALAAKAVSDEQKDRAKNHVKFGNMLASAGQNEKALHQYELAIAANPLSHSAHHNVASVLQRLNRFERAIPHYEVALRLKPTLVETASNLAVAQLNARRPADAIATCRHAIALQAEVYKTMNLEASHHLNVALRLVGRKDEAIESTWSHIIHIAAAARAAAAASGDAGTLGQEVMGQEVALRPPALVLSDGPPSLAASPSAITVVCVKWGTLYGAEYANKLCRGVRRALGAAVVGAHFVCFTDDADGLDADIEARPLPLRREEWKGWWHKAHLFSRAAGLEGRVLYIDLDTVIIDTYCMASLAAYDGPFATLSSRGFDAEEGYVDGYNTSVMVWEASGQVGEALRVLHDAVRPEVFQCLMRWDHWVEMLVPRAHLLQDVCPGLIVDYRSHCRASGPPEGAAVVCFPRHPKPHQVQSEWVVQHWR